MHLQSGPRFWELHLLCSSVNLARPPPALQSDVECLPPAASSALQPSVSQASCSCTPAWHHVRTSTLCGCALSMPARLPWLQGAGPLAPGVAGPSSSGLGGGLSLQGPAVGPPTLAGTMKHLGGNQTELSIAVPDNKVHTSGECRGVGGGSRRVCS